MALTPLNLDQTLPDDDSVRAANVAGIIRWLTSADPRTLGTMNRVLGDLGHRSFLLESKINEIVILIGQLAALPTLLNIMLIDGTTGFTGPVQGVDGTGPNTLITRAGAAALVGAQLDAIVSTVGLLADRLSDLETGAPINHYSEWVEHVWNAAVPNYIDLTFTPAITAIDRVVGINIVEKLDVAQPTIQTPDPTPIWRYRPAVVGSSRGATIDDAWLLDASTLRLLLPSTSAYSAATYPTGAAYDLPGARQRFFRASVIEHQ